jgi:hypothetical protein
MARPLGGDGEAVELARQPDREVADVDHLLHLAKTLLQDLAGFQADQRAELGLPPAQRLAEQAHQLAAARRRHAAPPLERRRGARDGAVELVRRRAAQRRQPASIDGRGHGEIAGGQDLRRQAERRCDGGEDLDGAVGHGNLRQVGIAAGAQFCCIDRYFRL